MPAIFTEPAHMRFNQVRQVGEATDLDDAIRKRDLDKVYASGVFNDREMIAGSGMAGGGSFRQDRRFDIGHTDNTIVVNEDSIQVGLITTANITNNSIDDTKIRDSLGTSVIGRSISTTGDPADIVATASGQFLRRNGAGVLGFGTILSSDLPSGIGLGDVSSSRNLIAGAGLTGGGNLTSDRTFNVATADATITVNPDSIQVGTINTANINDDQVTNAKLRNSVGTSVIGRSVNGAGDPDDIQATASGQFLKRDGTNELGFGVITTSDLPDITTLILNNSITDSKLRDSLANSVIGRAANTGGDPADIQATTNFQFLGMHSNTLAFAGITVNDLPNQIVLPDYVTLRAGANFPTNGFNLGSLSTGVLQQTVSASVSTPSSVIIASGLIPFGTPTSGLITTDTDIKWDSFANKLTVNGDVDILSDLVVSATSTLGGHVDATAGMAVSGGVLNVTGTGGTALNVVNGDADFDDDVNIDGSLTVDNTITAGFLSIGATTISPTSADFAGAVGVGTNLVVGAIAGVGQLLSSGNIGVWGSGGYVSKPTVTGSTGGNAALASLISVLATYGFIIDGTS